MSNCAAVGIVVVIQEESYTSLASFLDGDVMPVYGGEAVVPVFGGCRVSRGVYESFGRGFIHADVNGAWNILRKCRPSIGWCSGVVVTPENLVIPGYTR
jgi:putative transposase